MNTPLTITFLGTGTSSGVPMIGCECNVCTSTDPKNTRLRSSILVQSPTTTIVVDSGPDFRYQMLRAGVKKLDAVIFTHSHRDHLAGLDDVRAYNFIQQKAMPVYATEETQHAIKRDFYYAFAEHKYPGVPQFDIHTIDGNPFAVGDIFITPIRVKHLHMPVLGFRLGDFTYITDANFIEEEEKEKIRGSRILVLNALRQAKHISHFSLDEAIALSNELHVPMAYYTHISHQLGLHIDVENDMPTGRFLAYDGLVLNL